MERPIEELSGLNLKTLTIGLVVLLVSLFYAIPADRATWNPMYIPDPLHNWVQSPNADTALGPWLGLGFLVILILSAINKVKPRFLNRAEMAVIFTMIMFGVPMVMIGSDQWFRWTLGICLGAANWGGEYETSIFRYLSPLLGPKDHDLLMAVRPAGAPVVWGAWILPILWVSLTFIAQASLFGFLAIYVHKRWVDVEVLPFPVATIHSTIIESCAPQSTPSIFTKESKILWLGFIISFLIVGLPRLVYVVPWDITGWPSYKEGGKFVPEWDLTPLGLVPYVSLCIDLQPHNIGWGFLMPLDVLFGFIVGYFVFRWMFPIIWTGIGYIPEWPSGKWWLATIWQGGGLSGGRPVAWLFMLGGGIFLALAARDLWESRKTWGSLSGPLRSVTEDLRVVVIGYVASLILVAALYQATGVPFWLALVLWAWMSMVYLGGARVRAEGGGMWGTPFAFTGFPCTIFTFWLMTLSGLGASATVASVMTCLFFTSIMSPGAYLWTTGYMHLFIPGPLEAMKLGTITKTRRMDILKALVIAGVVTGFAATVFAVWWYHYADVSSLFGITGAYASWFYWVDAIAPLEAGRIPTNFCPSMEAWSLYGYEAVAFLVTGIIIVFALSFLRPKIPWLRINPIGIAFATIWGIEMMWVPLIIATILKWVTLRVGGVELYEKGSKMAVGTILGYALSAFLIQFFNGGHVIGYYGTKR